MEYIKIPAATAAFIDSTCPAIGSASRCVESARTAGVTPFPSLPMTSASGAFSPGSAAKKSSPPNSVETTEKPRSFRALSAPAS